MVPFTHKANSPVKLFTIPAKRPVVNILIGGLLKECMRFLFSLSYDSLFLPAVSGSSLFGLITRATS
jgi:hypothetical protein